MGICAPQVMIRFVGNALHESDFTRIDDWATKISEMYSAGVDQVYFFFHQEDEADGIVLTERLIGRLEEQVENVVWPIEWGGGDEEQMSFF